MIKCKNCGLKNSKEKIHCVSCGAELHNKTRLNKVIIGKMPTEKNEKIEKLSLRETVGGLFGLAILILFTFALVGDILFLQSANSTNATVIYFKNEGFLASSHWVYYSYEVDGIVYEGRFGTRTNFFTTRTVGNEFRLFYNPDDPSQARLISIPRFIILIVPLCIGVGGIIFIVSSAVAGRSRRDKYIIRG